MSWSTTLVIALGIIAVVIIAGIIGSAVDKRAEHRAIAAAGHTAVGREYAALRTRVQQMRNWHLAHPDAQRTGTAIAQRLDMLLVSAASDASLIDMKHRVPKGGTANDDENEY